MAWIESHQELGRHPKLKRLARELGVSRVTAVGHLHYLWWWALDYADDGDLSACDPADIAEEAMWDEDPDTFIRALVSAGFLSADNHIHDWGHYTGRIQAQREANRERQRRFRDRHAGESLPTETPNRDVTVTSRLDNAATVPNRTVPDQTVPEVPTAPARAPRESPPEPADAVPRQPVRDDQPFALLEALCDEAGVETSVVTAGERKKQLAAAKRMMANGIGPPEVRRMYRWVAGQGWVTGGIDLLLLEKQVGKWQMAGKPEAAAMKAAKVTNGYHPPPSHTERTADAVTGANAILARMYGWGDEDDVIDTTGRVTR